MSKHTPAHGHTNVDSKRSAVQNICFACGKDNADGMQLEFFFDVEAHKAVCQFTLGARYQGPPDTRMAELLPRSWMKRWARSISCAMCWR